MQNKMFYFPENKVNYCVCAHRYAAEVTAVGCIVGKQELSCPSIHALGTLSRTTIRSIIKTIHENSVLHFSI